MKMQLTGPFVTLLFLTLNSLSLAKPFPQNDSGDSTDNLDGLVTDDQMKWLNSLQELKCLQDSNCPPKQDLAPVCAFSDQSIEEDPKAVLNSQICLFSDKIWFSDQMKCGIKSCPKNIDDLLVVSYAMVYVSTQGKVLYPKPQKLLESLCLTDSLPKDYSVPDSLSDLDKNLDYKYADSWPEQTATTWIPPTVTGDAQKVEDYLKDSRPKLTCAAAEETGVGKDKSASATSVTPTTSGATPTSSASGNGTSNGNGTAPGEDDKGAASGLSVSWGMTGAVVGSVVLGALGVLL